MATATAKTATARADRRWGTQGAEAPSSSPGAAVNVERLVATYALHGRARRRQLQQRRVKLGGLGLAAALLVTLGLSSIGDLPELGFGEGAEQAAVREQLQSSKVLRAQLDKELAAIGQRRAELAEQRQALGLDLSAFESQQAELSARREDLAAQLADMDTERARLGAEQAALANEEPQLAAAMARVDARRSELKAQQALFADQTDELAAEINYLGAQRLTLEAQRQALESQWAELQALMDQVEGAGQPPTSPSPAPVQDEAIISELEAANIQASSRLLAITDAVAVAEEQLGDIRGAINLGEDMNIAIGLTRTATVNGVEEYSTSFQLDDLSAMGIQDLGRANTLLLQNGPGNSADPAALASLATGISTVIQNTLDNQQIATQTVLDVSIGNAARGAADIAVSNAIVNSLAMQP